MSLRPLEPGTPEYDDCTKTTVVAEFHDVTRTAVNGLIRAILEKPSGFDWSVQGLGMMRLYLNKNTRLHLWDSSLKVTGVSPIHTHPWHFRSHVISGHLLNLRFTEITPRDVFDTVRSGQYNRVKIVCGAGAKTVGETEIVTLQREPLENYRGGETYEQKATDIHWSFAQSGTVTVCHRTFLEDTEHANIYWPGDGPFVSAEPRRATQTEVSRVTLAALQCLDMETANVL